MRFWVVFRSERAVSTIFPPYIMPNGTYERIKKFSDTLPLKCEQIFNPKIYFVNFGSLHRAFNRDFPKKMQYNFPKMGKWVESRLQFFQKFIRFGSAIRPLSHTNPQKRCCTILPGNFPECPEPFHAPERICRCALNA